MAMGIADKTKEEESHSTAKSMNASSSPLRLQNATIEIHTREIRLDSDFEMHPVCLYTTVDIVFKVMRGAFFS